MSFADEVQQGFADAFALVNEAATGESGAPATLTFGSKTSPVVSVSIEDGQEMLIEGYKMEFDASAVLMLEDFRTLGLKHNSVVSIDGQRLKLLRWLREPPFVTLYLNAANERQP